MEDEKEDETHLIKEVNDRNKITKYIVCYVFLCKRNRCFI